jgi:hypothetical protein
LRRELRCRGAWRYVPGRDFRNVEPLAVQLNVKRRVSKNVLAKMSWLFRQYPLGIFAQNDLYPLDIYMMILKKMKKMKKMNLQYLHFLQFLHVS